MLRKLARGAASAGIAVLWSAMALAAPYDAPQLGVRIPDLPASASPPQLLDEADALALRFRIGAATARIERLNDAVPSGANVEDPVYRRSLSAYFGDQLGPKPTEQATSVAGQSAWTTCSFWHPGVDPMVRYVCITSFIIEQHLYRLTAMASGTAQRPPDFDAAIGVLSGIALEPIHAALAADGSPAPPPRRELQYQLAVGEFYPDKARRLNEQGAVDVEFSVDAHGHARDMKVDPNLPDLGEAAEALVSAARFRVPPTWQGESERHTWEIQFALAPPGQSCSRAPPRVVGVTVVALCGSMIPQR